MQVFQLTQLHAIHWCCDCGENNFTLNKDIKDTTLVCKSCKKVFTYVLTDEDTVIVRTVW